MLSHVLIYIFSLNFEKQAVGVSVQELAALSILTLHLVIIELYRSCLERSRMLIPTYIIVYIGSGKGWAGNKPPELVLFIRSHQLDCLWPFSRALYSCGCRSPTRSFE